MPADSAFPPGHTACAGVGYEPFASNGPDANRRFVSAGERRKVGVLSLSLEGHFGRIEVRG
ncbi:MAG: hypothetical protein OXE86_08120 [Alphaproteobacteria bacterium]|nr:hypothetical protein [Alphaproteobacteria bacterium]